MFIRNLQTIYVNSYYMRVTGSDSQFSINLNLPKNKKYNSISVSDIVIPKSYKLIDEKNNTLTLIENNVEIVITFDIGNYTVEQFMKRLGVLLTNNSLNDIKYNVRMYKSTICDTGLMQFQADNNVNNYEISFKISNNIAYLMGYNWPLTLGSKEPIIKTFVNNILISDQTINFAYTNNLYLTCNNCQSLKSTHLSNNNILTIIYNYQNYNSYFHHDQDMFTNEKHLLNDSTNEFIFSLIDEDGELVNLNNLDISFNLHIYYNDYEDFTNMLKLAIQYQMTPNDKKNEYLLVFDQNQK